jgi:hypothetical protein
MIATMQGAKHHERQVHKKVQPRRVRGEWFGLGDIKQSQAALEACGMTACLEKGPWIQIKCQICLSFVLAKDAWSYGCHKCADVNGMSPSEVDFGTRFGRKHAVLASFDLALDWLMSNEAQVWRHHHAVERRLERWAEAQRDALLLADDVEAWGGQTMEPEKVRAIALRDILRSEWTPYPIASSLWTQAGHPLIEAHRLFWLDGEILWVDAYTEMQGIATFRTKDRRALDKFETSLVGMGVRIHHSVHRREGWWQIRID